jgi:hypothetical protein
MVKCFWLDRADEKVEFRVGDSGKATVQFSDAVKTLTTHCKRGHERTPTNCRVDKHGNRHCRVCEKERRNAN